MQEFIDINKRHHKFHIKTKIFGKEVEGDFICKFPSVLDSLKIQVQASKYVEGVDTADLFETTLIQALELATIDVLLIKKPEWYDPSEIDDYEVISQVHKEIQDYTRTFREQLHQREDSGNSTESTDTEVMEGK